MYQKKRAYRFIMFCWIDIPMVVDNMACERWGLVMVCITIIQWSVDWLFRDSNLGLRDIIRVDIGIRRRVRRMKLK